MPLRSAAPSTIRATILLVDDNADGLTARKSVLEEFGHTITLACDGSDALAKFDTVKPDLVVTDYKMPRMDGLCLIREIRKKTPDIPIVLISGFVEALGFNEDITGADAVIQKSSNEVSHLVRTVQRLLRRGGGPPRKRQGKAGSPQGGSPRKSKGHSAS